MIRLAKAILRFRFLLSPPSGCQQYNSQAPPTLTLSGLYHTDKNKDEKQLTFEVDDAAVEESFREVDVLIEILLKYKQS